MNCKNCGAPLKLIEGRSYFLCEYCDTYYFPETLSPDDISLLGDKDSDTVCPVCEIALTSAAIEEVHVLYCSQCRGILASQEAFYNIVKYKRAKASGPSDRPRRLDPKDLQRSLNCPQCGRPMDTHPYYGPGNFVIDSCPHCALVWLDYGELRIIANAPGRDRGVGWRESFNQKGDDDDE